LVAFNVDPKFNNAIDGLMYIRIADIPESTVKTCDGRTSGRTGKIDLKTKIKKTKLL